MNTPPQIPLGYSSVPSHWQPRAALARYLTEAQFEELPEETTPDTLRGFRYWFISGDTLWPMTGIRYNYRPGWNHATCAYGCARSPSNFGCPVIAGYGCGIYVATQPFMNAGGAEYVAGVVEAKGKIVSHDDGFRAEAVRILALCWVPPAWGLDPDHLRCSPGQEQAMERAARAYGVPLMEAGELGAEYFPGFDMPRVLPKFARSRKGDELHPAICLCARCMLLRRAATGSAWPIRRWPFHSLRRQRLSAPRRSAECWGCGRDRRHHARGLCGPCYQRWRRAGFEGTGPGPLAHYPVAEQAQWYAGIISEMSSTMAAKQIGVTRRTITRWRRELRESA